MQNHLITTQPKPLEYYKEILIHADKGVHEEAAQLLQQYVPSGASVLDVGAGAGAFSQRLSDLEYKVTALDVDPDKWIPEHVPFLILNIDKGITSSVSEKFDAVCCLEVIEHVENHWNLLREIYKATKPGGYALVSTPNITSFFSRANFFLTGKFHQFDVGDLSYGHISPITAFHLSHAAKQIGWEIVEVRGGGYLPVFNLATIKPLLWTVAVSSLSLLSYLISKVNKHGWCLFFLLHKPAFLDNFNRADEGPPPSAGWTTA